ncbi:MAG: hypothetical protein ACHQPI_07520 [Thermoanaerobaculia bacterium]
MSGLSMTLALLLFAPAPPAGWPLGAELLVGADAAALAPPDFKRQLVKNRDRLMAGIRDAAASGYAGSDASAHRAAAAALARKTTAAIRARTPFDDIAFLAGGLVHEAAEAARLAATADAGELTRASKRARFLGYPTRPFADPEILAAGVSLPPGATPAAVYDAAVTTSTRLFAWVWKSAGGDASIVTKYPESGGPYPLRDSP